MVGVLVFAGASALLGSGGPSIGETETVGGLDITVERILVSDSLQTGEGRIGVDDLSESFIPDDADRFLLIVVDVDENEDATAYNDRVGEIRLLRAGSVYMDSQPFVNEVVVDGTTLDRFAGTADQYAGDTEKQVVVFTIPDGDLSNYRLKVSRNTGGFVDPSASWALG